MEGGSEVAGGIDSGAMRCLAADGTRPGGPVDVLLAHSYCLRLDRKQAEKMRPYPPLALLYAASLLRSA